jgi:hypothetical protein
MKKENLAKEWGDKTGGNGVKKQSAPAQNQRSQTLVRTLQFPWERAKKGKISRKKERKKGVTVNPDPIWHHRRL